MLYCPPALILIGAGTSVLATVMEFDICTLNGSTLMSGVKLNGLGIELMPVPVSVTTAVSVGEPARLLLMVSVPLRLPDAVGAKTTLMVHVCPAVRAAGQLFVCE